MKTDLIAEADYFFDDILLILFTPFLRLRSSFGFSIIFAMSLG